MNTTMQDIGTPIDVPLSELFIDHNFNVRGQIAPIDVAEFAKALDRDGLQQPITVRKYNNPTQPNLKYQVVAGHRRTMAFNLLKRKTIPAFLRTFEDELKAKTYSFIENLHRKDLNIKQEANGLKPYLEAYWSEGQIAEHLNQSRGWVKVRNMLLTMHDKIQDYAAAGLITQEHIKMMYGQSESKQFEFIKTVKEAKARGEKVVIDKPVKKTNPHTLKPKGREEIFELITRIYEVMPMGFWSRCMSCCAGQISEYELMKEVELWAIENGHPYRVPLSMVAERLAP